MKPRTKILKPATIIQQQVYVPRNADRELMQSISDMGRPAYVLVARQMGKTNLLVNAKRSLESPRDVFVYLDLTTIFEDVREFWRGVIDTAIDTHTELLEVEGGEIRAARENLFPAHKEHEIELRRILNAIPGKLVIFLDEIDALTRSAFSDQIFSQIRKTYFSRVNFPEYGRLTYVLSGVAEPNDLIKDPKLSPFNIGEKIYLTDFTFDEQLLFLQKSGLGDLMEDAAVRLFYWAGGNPRITWDICSALEDIVISGQQITPTVVDDVVQQLYLASNDRAPVDHIRSLVQSDRIIRDAITQIRYGKGSGLSDAIKSRLYMAGIIKVDVRSIQIKNKIIDDSLSDQWLHDVEQEGTDLRDLALARHRAGEHQVSIDLYEEYLRRNPVVDPITIAQVHHQIGLSYFALGKYTKSVEILQSLTFPKDVGPELYYARLALAGACQRKIGDRESAIVSFQQVLDGGSAAARYRYEVLLNLASTYVDSHFHDRKSDIIACCDEVLSASEEAERQYTKSELDKLRSRARICLSDVYRRSGDLGVARLHLEAALTSCTKEQEPLLLCSLAATEKTLEKRRDLLTRSVRNVIELELFVVDEADDTHPIDSYRAAEMLSACAEVDRRGSFQTLLRHFARGGRDRFQGNDNSLPSAVSVLLSNKNPTCMLVANALIDINSVEKIDGVVLLNCLRFGAAFSGYTGDKRVFMRYLGILQDLSPALTLEAFDWTLLSLGAVNAINARDLASSRSVLDFLESYIGGTGGDEPDQEYLLLVKFIAMRVAELEGDIAAQVECATYIDDAMPKLAKGSLQLPVIGGADGLRVFREEARRILRNIRQGSLARTGVGRNEMIVVRYADGRTATMKYKKAEPGLLAGTLEMISRVAK